MRFTYLAGAIVFAASAACSSDSTTPAGPPSVASVVVIVDEHALQAPYTMQARVLVRDSLARELTDRVVTWSSSNNIVATVSETGLIFAESRGTVIVTATSEGKSGSATIDILPPDPPVVRVRPGGQ